MSPRKLLLHVFLLSYLAVTGGALFFTLTHERPALLPWALVRLSYLSMAPYQGDTPTNGELHAEGLLADGPWEAIDLAPYYPYGSGEANARQFLLSFRSAGEQGRLGKYAELASLLLLHERERGKPYAALRLSFDEWPRSPAGFAALHHPPLTARRLLAEVR